MINLFDNLYNTFKDVCTADDEIVPYRQSDTYMFDADEVHNIRQNEETMEVKTKPYGYVVLVDNGHGYDTKGKRSPDGTLLEWQYTREIASAVVNRLRMEGINAVLLVTENNDVSLSVRNNRANAYCTKLGAKNVVLVSIHCNASGSDGGWHTASGWEVEVGKTASTYSKRLASILFSQAKAKGLKMRRPTPTQDYWQRGLQILDRTKCPCVLTENLFQDNRNDCTWLLSPIGREVITDIHVKGIKQYLKEYNL